MHNKLNEPLKPTDAPTVKCFTVLPTQIIRY